MPLAPFQEILDSDLVSGSQRRPIQREKKVQLVEDPGGTEMRAKWR